MRPLWWRGDARKPWKPDPPPAPENLPHRCPGNLEDNCYKTAGIGPLCLGIKNSWNWTPVSGNPRHLELDICILESKKCCWTNSWQCKQNQVMVAQSFAVNVNNYGSYKHLAQYGTPPNAYKNKQLASSPRSRAVRRPDCGGSCERVSP